MLEQHAPRGRGAEAGHPDEAAPVTDVFLPALNHRRLDGDPDTGSEVSIAMAARDLLQADGIPAAVVSMPCWELFDAQDGEYRNKILGTGVRVAVEAAVVQGWEKYIGDGGGFVGMTGFGASAPGGQLFEHFGITAEAVVSEVKKRLS